MTPLAGHSCASSADCNGHYGRVTEPKAVVHALFRRTVAGDANVLKELVAEDTVNHAAGLQGREGLRQISRPSAMTLVTVACRGWPDRGALGVPRRPGVRALEGSVNAGTPCGTSGSTRLPLEHS